MKDPRGRDAQDAPIPSGRAFHANRELSQHGVRDTAVTGSTHQPRPANACLLQVNDVRIDTRYRRVVRPDQSVELPQRTFDLLMLFLAEPHVLHSRTDLFQRVWPGVIVEDANLSQAVWVLRKALGPERKDWIRTVAKGGYVFAPPESIQPVPVDEPEAVAEAPPPPLLGAAPPPTPPHRAWMAMAALCLVSLAAAASWFGNQPAAPAERATNVLLVEVQDPTGHSDGDHWRTALLHAWLDWKLRALPHVNVLREENLVAESSPARPKLVLLATGDSPERKGDIYIRASFEGVAGPESVQLKGRAGDLPRLVDAASRQVMQRLIPARLNDDWPPLELDPASARRFAETFKAMERRDWATARAAAQDVIQQSPRFGVARLQLAIALGRLGQAGLAVEQFAMARAILKPLPEDAGKVIDALQLAADPRRLAEAAEASGALARAYPERRGFLLDQARLLARIGHLDEAHAILSQPHWQQQAPGLRIPQQLALSDLYLQLGDPRQARAHARRAQTLARNAGNDWRIEHAMALALDAEGSVTQNEGKADLAKFEQAAKEFEQAGDEIDALFVRFLAASARPPDAAATAQQEALLQRAREGGYRRLEIDILRRTAFQHYIAGNVPEYRSRLSEALTVANAAGDSVAQQHLILDLLNEDMAVGDFASAEQRIQRLRDAGLRGERALWVAQFASQLQFLRGQHAAALATLDHAVAALKAEKSPLPPIAQARTACGKADVLATQGELAEARRLYAACGRVDHGPTRLVADLGAAVVDVLAQRDARPDALLALLARVNALPDGPDRWAPALLVAPALTRVGMVGQAHDIYLAVESRAKRAGYHHLLRMAQVGLAEVAAARGEWAASVRHAQQASASLPPDDWFLGNRLAALAIGRSLALGHTGAAMRQLARLDARAHALGDAIVQQELHDLMPPSTVIGQCSASTRAALARRTGLHGATLAWAAPRTDSTHSPALKLAGAGVTH